VALARAASRSVAAHAIRKMVFPAMDGSLVT
jgi:hypothetical protein